MARLDPFKQIFRAQLSIKGEKSYWKSFTPQYTRAELIRNYGTFRYQFYKSIKLKDLLPTNPIKLFKMIKYIILAIPLINLLFQQAINPSHLNYLRLSQELLEK